MKPLAYLAWFAGATALAFAQQNKNANVTARSLAPADETAIRAASKIYEEGGNARDWPRVLAIFSDDIVFMPPNAPATIGRKAVAAMLNTYPAFKHLRLEPLEMEGRGDLAFVRGRYSFVLTPPNQPEQPDTGKYIEIWRKQPNGAWKYARGIFNSDLPPPAPAAAMTSTTAAPAPWLGTWVLNLAKTRINPSPAPRSQTRTYNATADGEKATYDMIEADGKRLYQEAVYRLDGQHVPLVGNPHADTQALRRTGPRSLAGETKRDGKVLHTARREVSEDGKVLTVEFKGTNRKGQPIIEEVWVFEGR